MNKLLSELLSQKKGYLFHVKINRNRIIVFFLFFNKFGTEIYFCLKTIVTENTN